MQIQHLEIANFRKLLSVRLDLAPQTTLLVGANNSGKSSAVLALRRFLLSKASGFRLQDLTLCHLATINSIGQVWETADDSFEIPAAEEWADWLPTLDIWLSASQGEIHYIRDLIPNFAWRGGLVGMRFRLEPDDIKALFLDYRNQRARVATLQAEIDRVEAEVGVQAPLPLWPASLHDYLNRRLGSTFKIRWYRLDPNKLTHPDAATRRARLQSLPPAALPLDRNPLNGLIRIHEINAQRGFTDGVDDGQDEGLSKGGKRLSEQLRAYYQRHLDPGDSPDVSDLEALRAIEAAQVAFNTRLGTSFEPALREVEGLGYPGSSGDPKIRVATKLAATDGMSHEAAVLFELDSVGGAPGAPALSLPETSNGLGYQNLISMIFRLMSFRDDWLRKYRAVEDQTDAGVEPIHLVLIEEPEAHLHAQVQQVFVKHAYHVLRRDELLVRYPNLKTQLLVSTHSSHVTHEVEYQNLRYFRRLPAGMGGVSVPTSTVSNLSSVFGEGNQTKEFVTRYLRALHADLFFADGVILVEGAAERMILPHFIRQQFPFLDQCYITILDIGGSHAHRLRPLIDALGIVTLVITDIDAGINRAATPVQRGADQVTNNPTVRYWMKVMGLEPTVDVLLDLPAAHRTRQIDELFAIRIAYQTPISLRLPTNQKEVEALPNTFEDSLVLSNVDYFAARSRPGLSRSFSRALSSAESIEALAQALFEALRNGDKAEFALYVLGDSDFSSLQMPAYIQEGLVWLQSKLRTKQSELMVMPAEAVGVTA